MNNPIIDHKIDPSGMHKAIVRMKEDEFYWVQLDNTLRKTRKAVSCIIEPEVKDEVMIFSNSMEEAYILAILTRRSSLTMKIPFKEDVDLEVESGKLGIRSENLDLTAEKDMNIRALNLNTFADRVLEKFNRLYKEVKEFEENQIGRFRSLIKGMFQVKAKEASVDAEEKLKMNSDRIEIG